MFSFYLKCEFTQRNQMSWSGGYKKRSNNKKFHTKGVVCLTLLQLFTESELCQRHVSL